MENNHLNSFDLRGHDHVLIKLGDTDLMPSEVDFDFTITKAVNSVNTARLTIYNMPFPKVGRVQLLCQDKLAFEYVNPGKWLDVALSMDKLSSSAVLAIAEPWPNIPRIFSKGDPFPFALLKSKGRLKQSLTLTRDYVFAKNSSSESRLSTIVKSEPGLTKIYYASGGQLYLQPAGGLLFPLGGINRTEADLGISRLVHTYGSEEVLVVSNYNHGLEPLQQVELTVGGEVKVYTTLAVEINWDHKFGLTQVSTMLTGERLQHFLENID